MISPTFFYEELHRNDVDFFCGVPDSLLKDFCAYITDNVSIDKHLITANEGAAIGLASGYHLATDKYALVYMQNSGIGNAVNPLLSLVDPKVYSIPMILLIGWRGEPGVKDEPQHIKQGEVTVELLNSMGIKNVIMTDNEDELVSQIENCISYIKEHHAPYAFVVKKGVFDRYDFNSKSVDNYPLTRENAIKIVANRLGNETVIVSTTGMISRELYEYREKMESGHSQEFLTVGSMGHASQIALGISLVKKEKRVACFDGDGAALMHLGSMAIIGCAKPSNYLHIVFNNGAHDSVGGQPTVGFDINFPLIANACGYKCAYSVDSEESFEEAYNKYLKHEGPCLIEFKVRKGARKDLGRPKSTPIENKISFKQFIQK